jgi:hypothetical protein
MSRHERLVFSPVTFVQNIANAIAADKLYRGTCPDTILKIRVAEALRGSPEAIDYAYFGGRLVTHFHSISNKTLNKAKGFYIPGVFIKVQDGLSVQMRRMELPHLDLWDELDDGLTKRFNDKMGRKRAYRQEWRGHFKRRPELPFLEDVQREIYGYVEKPTEDPFVEDDDDEDEPV